MTKIIFGNWKMNHGLNELRHFVRELSELDDNEKVLSTACGIAPQFPHIMALKELTLSLPLVIGGQNSVPWEIGAYLAEFSARTLADVGASFVLIGHSERRLYFREGHDLLTKKMQM